jgi:hypothetical protein
MLWSALFSWKNSNFIEYDLDIKHTNARFERVVNLYELTRPKLLGRAEIFFRFKVISLDITFGHLSGNDWIPFSKKLTN